MTSNRDRSRRLVQTGAEAKCEGCLFVSPTLPQFSQCWLFWVG